MIQRVRGRQRGVEKERGMKAEREKKRDKFDTWSLQQNKENRAEHRENVHGGGGFVNLQKSDTDPLKKILFGKSNLWDFKIAQVYSLRI